MLNRRFRVNVVTEGLSAIERVKVQEAAEHFEDAVNSKQFYQFCHPYRRGGGKKKVRVRTSPIWRFWNRRYKTIEVDVPYEGDGFKNPNGRSDAEVYRHLLTGAEVLDPQHDQEADIYFKVDRRNKRSVIGYTYSNTKWQWLYQNWLKSYTPGEIAGNMAHEWVHKMGYKHAFRNNSTRKYTVPYAVGYFVRDFQGE